MAKGKKHTAEEIIGKLREAEIYVSQGRTQEQAAKQIGVTCQTYCRWRKEYGGMKVDQAKRLKELEKENAQLRRARGYETAPEKSKSVLPERVCASYTLLFFFANTRKSSRVDATSRTYANAKRVVEITSFEIILCTRETVATYATFFHCVERNDAITCRCSDAAALAVMW